MVGCGDPRTPYTYGGTPTSTWRQRHLLQQQEEFVVLRVRCTRIDAAIPAKWLEPPKAQELMPRDARWLGQFTPQGIPRVVAGQLANTTAFFFVVSEDKRLRREGALIDLLLPWQRIRVVGLLGKAWQIEPIIKQDQVQQW